MKKNRMEDKCMSGEKSKGSGEYGEGIARQFLKLIGWENALTGKDIPCVRKDIHKNAEGNPRQNHGVDFIVKYECSLMSRVECDVLISVKHRDGYPTTTKGAITEFKTFLKDITEATECYPAHELFSQHILGTNKINISNVIMWINSQLGKENEGVISEIQDFRNNENIDYKTVYLIDNKKANFLYSSIQHVKNKGSDYYFYYPDTGINMDTVQRKHQGYILPVQYINSPIQLFKVIESTGECLVITTEDDFTIEYFERLVQLARLTTEGWASKIIIAFPNYNDYGNKEDVKKAILQIRDETFAKKINVERYNYSDFRNIGGN
jgi:hypothetical protein